MQHIQKVVQTILALSRFLVGAVLGCLSLIGPSHAVDVFTPPRLIEGIQVNTAAFNLGYYLVNTGVRWGAAGCENATYVAIDPAVVGAKELLMLASIAKVTERAVSIYGECLSPDYFKGKVIYMAP